MSTPFDLEIAELEGEEKQLRRLEERLANSLQDARGERRSVKVYIDRLKNSREDYIERKKDK